MRSRSMLAALLMSNTPALLVAAQLAPPAHPDTRGPAAASTTPGDRLFVDGRWAEAATAYTADVAKDPNSAPVLAALARLRLYQHRENEAAALARKSMALAPDNALAPLVLRTADRRRAAFGSDQYLIDPGSTTGAVDFLITDPLPVVRVGIAGRQANFLIDTGAPDIAFRGPVR